MMEHMSRLFEFYGFNTARYRWKKYVGSQIAIESSVNILLNGGNKYNKNRRKNTKRNGRKRRKARRAGDKSRGTSGCQFTIEKM
ncbi:uncharacterized protein BX663DRAFT_525340 [Cokeromyces recurvatus]|uniref:uncharacterized protein n=1 Tax=Cokeromyces recurvatus TaxID=90255 RepID=UPI00221FB564|nr:uncharacterized protein BX663DRAFT_525340 [Cokeromyces recurvatus]KAI7898294.1 hypothetical protein BX663DRAFT_525340 [Cokeromyces recurvatus]